MPPACSPWARSLGGHLGARFGRRLPSAVLRTAIVVLGVVGYRAAVGPMSVLEFGLLVLAGIGAGLVGSIAGLASLISYPALLAAGVPPVTANMTNTVALVLNGVGSVSASRPELKGQGRRLLRLAGAAALGGAAGAALLLSTPSSAFERIVPWLIAGAAIALLVSRPPRRWRRKARASTPTTGIPGGCRSARSPSPSTAGTSGPLPACMLLAMYLLTTGEGLPRGNALRNVVLGIANSVAAVGFILFAPIAWSAALPLAIGLFAGGRLGPRVVRRAPQTLLRRLIAIAGLALAIILGIQAYF